MAVHTVPEPSAQATAAAPGPSLSPLAELLNPWQRRFPLVEEPFALIARGLGRSEAEVLDGFAAAAQAGLLSRLGGVFDPRAGGDSLLVAMAVPAARLAAVAQQVSALPGVNHNYEREATLNLWFVLTGPDAAQNGATLDALERATGLPALRLRMRRAYRIDLGFDLRSVGLPAAASSDPPAPPTPAATPDEARGPLGDGARSPSVIRTEVLPLSAAERPLAALVEAGLPLVPRPYEAWARTLARDAGPDARGEPLAQASRQLRATLAAWLADGRLRRFGAVLRHHEAGVDCNAMTVFDVPDSLVDACGARLARQPGVTLAYCRQRAPGWPYNLYCMVHGRSRATVLAQVEAAASEAGLQPWPRQVLFSRRRFKQTGATRFALATGHPGTEPTTGPAAAHTPMGLTLPNPEACHVAC